MITAVLYGILSMLGYGLSSAIAQKPIRALGSIKAIFYRNIIISIVLFIVLLFQLPETISAQHIALAFAIAFLGYIPFVTFFKGLGTGKIGVVVPISNSAVIVTVLLSLTFLNETLTKLQAGAIALIVIGIILTSINFKDFKKSHLFHLHSGVPYALITCILWGVFWFVWKHPVTLLGPFFSAFIQELSMVIYSGVHLKLLKQNYKWSHTKTFIIMGILAAAGTLFFNLGLQTGPVSIVAPLVFANALVSTLYSRIIYKEKLSTTQYVAAALIIVGIVLVSL